MERQWTKCPVCGLARRDDKVAKKHGPTMVEVFADKGCKAIGERHFGDSRMDSFARGLGAVMATNWTVLDMAQREAEAKRAESD